MPILFIADLHLSKHQPLLAKAFFDYLQYRASDVESLYILGDFFDFWIGDDAMTPFDYQVAHAIRDLVNHGVAVYLMHGNRDFLIGEKFAQEAKIELIQDPTLIELNAMPVLLMHGDSLCTDDAAYMQMRQQTRDPQWQADFLRKPIDQRLALAQQLRDYSQKANATKMQEIMDVNQTAVIAAMQQFQVQNLIHGHTHRPDIHQFTIDHRTVRRYVLGDWQITEDLSKNKGWDIRSDVLSLTLQPFQLSSLAFH